MESREPSAIEFSIRYEQRICRYKKIHLSLGQYTPPSQKKIVYSGHTKVARKRIFEHISQVVHENRIKDLNKPLMIISVRNVLSNLRCLAYIKGYTVKPLSVAKEYESLISFQNSQFHVNRPYYILGEKNVELAMQEWSYGSNNEYSWFISGVPVLWDDEKQESIFEKIATEASDHSHVWHIPRGDHPDAISTSRNHWTRLQKIFIETLFSPRKEAFTKLEEYANENSLKREDKYLHHLLGIDEERNLYQLIDTGMLEDLGQKIKARGAKRAICVDNSGSVAVWFCPEGFSGARAGNIYSCVAAPNHRLQGTAYLIIELDGLNFNFFEEKGK